MGSSQMCRRAGRVLLVPVALVLACHQSPAGEGSAAGVSWTAPKRWAEEPGGAMRVVTYRIPAAAKDAEPAECGVFFFGAGQGGDADANVQRWMAQFEGGPKPVRSSRKVGGLEVTLLQVAGTFLSGGPMVAVKTRKENFRLLGAIVAAPQGTVFFKLTGPAATVQAAQSEFDALVASLKTH